MQPVSPISRAMLVSCALVIAFTCGASFRNATPVHASSADLQYQFDEEKPSTSLSLYSPDEHAIYVYAGVNAGNTHVSCSYKLIIKRWGGPIDRQNCPPGTTLP